MKIKHPTNNRLSLLVLIVLTIITLQIGWWMVLSSDPSLSFEELQAKFIQPYPALLGSPRDITAINLLLALGCWWWTIRNLVRATNNVIGWMIFVWNSVLVLWLGFSLS